MSYSIYLALAAATAGHNNNPEKPVATAPDLADALQPAWHGIRDLVERFRGNPVSPLTSTQFENDLQGAVRELARLTAQWTYNHLEPADVAALPLAVRFHSSTFRRLRHKTPQQVSTLFGPITLRRLGYRAAPMAEPCATCHCRRSNGNSCFGSTSPMACSKRS